MADTATETVAPMEEVIPKTDNGIVEPAAVKEDTVPKTDNDTLEPAALKVEDVPMTENGTVEPAVQNGSPVKPKTPSKPLSAEVALKVVQQIEYYFGNYNLPRDKFLSEEVKKDDGWVPLSTMCKFVRLAKLTKDEDLIAKALEKATIIEVNATELKIRRSPAHPLPDLGDDVNAETVKRTIYLKGCRKDGSVTLDILLEYFKQYGPYEAIKMRKYTDHTSKVPGFKGSILVIYSDVEGAKKLMEEEEIIFQNGPLLRKWYAEYLEEKKKEIDERRAEKAARQSKNKDNENKSEAMKEQDQEDPKPTGTFLHISGLPNTTSREDIKEIMGKNNVVDIAFVGLKRGETEGYIRLETQFSNMDAVGKLKGKLEVGETEATVRAVIGTEEIEQLKVAREVRANMINQSNKRKRDGGHGGGRGRGGGRRGGRGFGKRRKM